MILSLFVLAFATAATDAQFTVGSSFQENRTVTVVQEGVSFDNLVYQDSDKGKVLSHVQTALGYTSQFTFVNLATKQGTLFYTYDVNNVTICYEYNIGPMPLPFPPTPQPYEFVKYALYKGKTVGIYEANVGRYVRRMMTDFASVVPGHPFSVILTEMEGMSMMIDVTLLNNTETDATVFNLPRACTQGNVKQLRSPVIAAAPSKRNSLPPQVKFNVRDPQHAQEEFNMLIDEVRLAMKHSGFDLLEYVPQPQLVEHGVWVGPSSIDNRAYASGIRDQGICGACWAFSSAALSEVVFNKKNNISYPVGSSNEWFSVQNLIDCATGNLNGTALFPSKGCFGGWPLVALSHIVQHGVAMEYAYPFDSTNGRQCLQPTSNSSLIFPLSSAQYISLNNGPATNLLLLMSAIVSEGAVIAIMNADPILFYPGGIFDSPCTASLGHAVTLIGFGTSADGIDYWIVKNSFGAAWGEGGFFRLVRGQNLCGIEQMGFVATGAPL